MPRLSIPILTDDPAPEQAPALPCKVCGKPIGTCEPISVETRDGATLQTSYFGLIRLLLGGLAAARITHRTCER
jgi:hypothetical protein